MIRAPTSFVALFREVSRCVRSSAPVKAAVRSLTQRELNRALLARQLLIARADLSPEAALEQVGGLQTQYAPSGYIGLWTRPRSGAIR